MTIEEAIRGRYSVKSFSDRPIARDEIEALLELAVAAPNHRMTEPWGFVVLGDEARQAYARVLGRRKSSKVNDPEAARLVREKVERNAMSIPAFLVVTVHLAEDPEIREEDYAATWMAIQNIALGAIGRGLGTHIKTGAVMNDPGLRAAWGIPEDRRVVAMIELGDPAGEPRLTERASANTRTTWLD